MTRRVGESVRTVVVIVLTLVGTLVAVAPAGAQEDDAPPRPTETTAPVPPPTASIVVDVETGEIITQSNAREPLPPASTTKILTALLVRQNLDWDGTIGISATATLAPPRRIGFGKYQQWGVQDLVHAMMLCSCNDAAWALGQAAGGGSMPGFTEQAQALAERLGMTDGPVLRDPAGLDDDRSVEGGNLLSAHDLAIAARAFLADPELAAVAIAPDHVWMGGDGVEHSVTNLNAFLGAYDGALGIKTGYTSRAGLTFVGAAERDGRTLVAVVLGSDAHYAHARELLDAGFMLAHVEDTSGESLPDLPEGMGPTTTTTTTTSTVPEPASSEEEATVGTDQDDLTGAPSTDADLLAAGGDGRQESLFANTAFLASIGVVLLLGLVAALVARSRMAPPTIDRRPVKPRRRDRRRAAGSP